MVVAVSVALLIRRVRTWIWSKIEPTYRQVWPRLVWIMSNPKRLAVGVGGTLLPEVRSGCFFLGLDPLYLANEGKFLCILPEELADQALQVLRSDPLGGHAARIGEVRSGRPGRVVLQTALGGSRLMDMLEGEQLPRIC